MFNGENNYSLADIAAATRNDDGFGSGNSWWIILLFLFIFIGGGWGGYGTRNGGVAENYVLNSDFASLERQMNSGFTDLRQQGTQIANGISSLGYDQLSQMNGINQNINTATNVINSNLNGGFNSLAAQLNAHEANRQQCCCNTNNLITTGFADINYNMASQNCQTRQAVADGAAAITANADCNTRSILNAIQNMQTQALQDKISQLTADKQALQLAASQQAQNAYLISALNPTPAPAYVVPNPITGTYGYRGCGCCSATA